MAEQIEVNPNAPAFTKQIDLAQEKLGGETLMCTDDFFAPMTWLIKPGRGVFYPQKFTEYGQYMEGWESRRKRVPGHDWCIIKLGASGVINGLDIDTNHFLGNHPPHASVEAICIDEKISNQDLAEHNDWEEILPKSPLDPGSQHFFDVDSNKRYTHVKLHIYPDGGVARLRVYGEVYKNWDEVADDEVIDLAAALNGGKAVLCNDMFFSHMGNIIMPGRGVNMGDGWETKRNRTPNNFDWVVIKLAKEGTIKKATIDTAHFKGNFPHQASLEGVNISDDSELKNAKWETILPKMFLKADAEHHFEKEILSGSKTYTHVRISIYPDGGVSRLRLFGVAKK
jgi:allantoicase